MASCPLPCDFKWTNFPWGKFLISGSSTNQKPTCATVGLNLHLHFYQSAPAIFIHLHPAVCQGFHAFMTSVRWLLVGVKDAAKVASLCCWVLLLNILSKTFSGVWNVDLLFVIGLLSMFWGPWTIHANGDKTTKYGFVTHLLHYISGYLWYLLKAQRFYFIAFFFTCAKLDLYLRQTAIKVN